MVITQSSPYTPSQIESIKQEFDFYIKTVIDLEKKICSAGCNRHYESEKILLDQGSNQNDLWGGGVDLETHAIDFNSMINIRPVQGNPSNEIQDPELRKQYEELTKYFFSAIYGSK